MGEFHAQRFAESLDGGFGDRVPAAVGFGDRRGAGADHDDPAVAAGAHGGQGGTDDPVGADDVGTGCRSMNYFC